MKMWRKMNTRIGVTKNWALGLQERQETTSAKCASSQWAPLCDCLTLAAGVLVFRTTGSKWYDAKLYGEFAESWFFLMKKKGGDGPHAALLPEWPSLCSYYRRNIGFGLFEPGRPPVLTAFKDSKERT